MKTWLSTLYLLIFGLILTSCGGGGGGDGDLGQTTTTGYFKDSNTAGLTYQSGGINGLTEADGKFTCETGNTVTFSVGGVVLGTASCGPIVTPIDLVASGSIDNSTVLNIVRFLMMLDDDGDPENGITISTAVQTAASDWAQVDFTTTDLVSALLVIMTELGDTYVLPDPVEAQSHLEPTVRCAYAGGFIGTYNGDDNGYFGVIVDAGTGTVDGYVYSILYDMTGEVSGSTPMSLDQSRVFTSGGVNNGATFSGQFQTANSVNGNWNNSYTLESGTFSGQRVGGSPNAVYRFTGRVYGGDSYGLFTFDVDPDNNVTGLGYDVTDDSISTIGGTFTDEWIPGPIPGTGYYITTITGTVSDGTVFSGDINKSTGEIDGTWEWSDGVDYYSGYFTGSGCKLN